jgi:hypothetical protein
MYDDPRGVAAHPVASHCSYIVSAVMNHPEAE